MGDITMLLHHCQLLCSQQCGTGWTGLPGMKHNAALLGNNIVMMQTSVVWTSKVLHLGQLIPVALTLAKLLMQGMLSAVCSINFCNFHVFIKQDNCVLQYYRGSVQNQKTIFFGLHWGLSLMISSKLQVVQNTALWFLISENQQTGTPTPSPQPLSRETEGAKSFSAQKAHTVQAYECLLRHTSHCI